MQPIRCLSSEWASHLLEFRNSGRTEAEWLVHPEVTGSSASRLCRILTTQMALPLLTLSTLVEGVVYSLFALGSASNYCLGICSWERVQYWREHLSSAQFTAYWNISNFFVFNLFYKNVFANESLMRFALDLGRPESPGQGVERSALLRSLGFQVAFLEFLGLTLVLLPIMPITGTVLGVGAIFISVPAMFDSVKGFQRPVDESYMQNWMENHPVAMESLRGCLTVRVLLQQNRNGTTILNRNYEEFLVISNLRKSDLKDRDVYEKIKEKIKESLINEGGWDILCEPGIDIVLETDPDETDIALGANFFHESILSGDIDEETKKKIREADPEAFSFVTAVVIYHYVCGNKKNDPLPNFLKLETRLGIERLRREFEKKEVHLEERLRSLEAFNKGKEEGNRDQDFQLFLKVKGLASDELQHSLFLTRCWSLGLQPN